VALTPGSITLTAYSLTIEGLNWGRTELDMSQYSSRFYEKRQIFLTETFLGFFMVPDTQIWNYSFLGADLDQLSYALILGNPKGFYDDIHR
jgi:pre-mRNA-processing factor 8